MSVHFDFDLTGAAPSERNLIQSFFERFGWQHTGGSSYSYPRQGSQSDNLAEEDWFNHVIPALMLFRAYIVDSGRELPKFTLNVQSSTSRDMSSGLGTPPLRGNDIELHEPSNRQFGESNLRQWLEGVKYPY